GFGIDGDGLCDHCAAAIGPRNVGAAGAASAFRPRPRPLPEDAGRRCRAERSAEAGRAPLQTPSKVEAGQEMSFPYVIEPLSTVHDRDSFDCGEPSLNDFLKRFARQNDEKGLGRTFVAVSANTTTIKGYYTLSNGSLKFDNVPEKLPRYPIPVAHL